MKAIAGLLDMVPGWVWALLVAALALTNCASLGRMQAAKVSAAEARETLSAERMRQEKALGDATASVLRLERELGAERAAQEIRDAENKTVVDDLRTNLRRQSRAGGGNGLRDPNATSGSCSPTSAATASPGRGEGDTAEAGGLLSEPLEKLLLQITDEADTINIAYIACRDDSLSLRLRLNTQLSPSLPSAGLGFSGTP